MNYIGVTELNNFGAQRVELLKIINEINVYFKGTGAKIIYMGSDAGVVKMKLNKEFQNNKSVHRSVSTAVEKILKSKVPEVSHVLFV